MLDKLLLTALTAIAVACVSPTVMAGYTSITVFGDSLSDGGNDFIYTGGAFPPAPYAQRFTNGPTAVEVLAADLKLPLTPSLAGGTNFAFGGAETGTQNFLRVSTSVPPIINTVFSGPPGFPATGVMAQVQGFVGGGGTFTPNSLVVLWAGPNDFLTALTVGNPPLANVIASAIGNLVNEAVALYARGARTILMPNMANLGLTPFGLTSGNAAGLTAVSMAFDLGLDQAIDQLELGLPGLDIKKFDIFSALGFVIANAPALGFTNSTDHCLNPVTLIACANPDQYVFWDDVHPTARVQRILGDLFAAAVPEPATLILLAVGLAGAGVFRRRKLT